MFSYLENRFSLNTLLRRELSLTVYLGSSDPPEKIFMIFASENEVYTIYQLLQYFRLNSIRSQSKIILGHMNSIG